MRQTKFLGLAVLTGAVLLSGCSKRKNPTDTGVLPAGSVVVSAPRFINTLDAANNALILNNLRPEPESRRVRVYLPP
ncbi:MAG TPA: hypothetical protein VI546_00615, partial [candidate division Zixibacteria bacterium]|nr:hypothetical protein [candidate division Zixibacteria bacterium]